MRIRGLIAILISIPAWIYVVHIYDVAKNSPFAYEFGSVAWPTPPLFRLAGVFAWLSVFVGALLLLFDFVRWVKKGRDS